MCILLDYGWNVSRLMRCRSYVSSYTSDSICCNQHILTHIMTRFNVSVHHEVLKISLCTVVCDVQVIDKQCEAMLSNCG